MAKENNRSSYFGDVVKKFLAHRLAMMGTIVLLIEVLAVLLLPAGSIFHGLYGFWRWSFTRAYLRL